MAKLWSDILAPIAIAGALIAQTAGVELSRASKVRHSFPNVQRKDTTAIKDTIIVKDKISEEEEEEFFLFGEEDKTPKVFARDTMKVPDSLKTTDPFLYEWYVAVKDAYTHRLVVDSLKEAGDSLVWPVIDSLYIADSTAVAKAAFEKWYAGLSKSERKRYDYERKLPAIRHRQDSIRHHKDSIKRVKDSIVQSTPRILETSFLPDSMHYKRIVNWKHERYFNSIETFFWDTTANYHFYDYPFMRTDVGASWLGMPGSPVQQYNYFLRDTKGSPSYFQALESWTYTPDNLTFFNTKTPYTELEYYGNLFSSKTLSADSYRVFTTQNILPSLNVSLEMKRYGGAGTLRNEETHNRSYFVTGNYLGKRYLAHGGLIYNVGSRQESGGVQETKWIRDTTVDVREISVNMESASTRHKKLTVFYDQSYRIPFNFIEKLRHRGDSTWTMADTVNTDITTAFVGTSTEYTRYTKKYVDNYSQSLSDFYNGQFFINPSKSSDSLRTAKLENRIFIRVQPWKDNSVISKVEGGVGHRFQNFYLQSPTEVLYKPSNISWNTFYAYAGAEGQLKRYFNWTALGQYNFAGNEVNDFFIKADATVNVFPFRRHPNSPISLKASFETRLDEPDFYQQHFYSNHYKWENNFGKISTTKAQATLDIPSWDLKVMAGYALLAGNVYYDTLGIVRQNADPMSVITAGLTKNFVFGPVHLENSALLQFSSNQDVLPLPLLALNLRWYVQFNIVDPKVLQLQAGINARYTTKWYAPAFNPVAGVFTSQNKESYGNCPVFDVFINMQWKKCCIFIKLENAGNGWPMKKHDYFTAHRYIQTSRAIKFGISWPFYPMLGKMRKLSDRAGSGFGGGGGTGGSSGGLSGLRGGIGGMLNNNR